MSSFSLDLPYGSLVGYASAATRQFVAVDTSMRDGRPIADVLKYPFVVFELAPDGSSVDPTSHELRSAALTDLYERALRWLRPGR